MRKQLIRLLVIVLAMIMSTLLLSGCGNSDPAGISGKAWYMVMGGSTYVLDINGDGTARMYRADYKDDVTQSDEIDWKSVGDNEYQFSSNGGVSGIVYDIDNADFTSTQILELGAEGYNLYFLQNEDDAQMLFQFYGGMKPDFLE